MSDATPSPRPGGHDPDMKLIRVLQTLNLMLIGAAIFAPSPWSWMIGVLAVIVTLVLAWMST